MHACTHAHALPCTLALAFGHTWVQAGPRLGLTHFLHPFCSCRERCALLCWVSTHSVLESWILRGWGADANILLSLPRIFVNRSLALGKIRCLGFDMDYTLPGREGWNRVYWEWREQGLGGQAPTQPGLTLSGPLQPTSPQPMRPWPSSCCRSS